MRTIGDSGDNEDCRDKWEHGDMIGMRGHWGRGDVGHKGHGDTRRHKEGLCPHIPMSLMSPVSPHPHVPTFPPLLSLPQKFSPPPPHPVALPLSVPLFGGQSWGWEEGEDMGTPRTEGDTWQCQLHGDNVTLGGGEHGDTADTGDMRMLWMGGGDMGTWSYWGHWGCGDIGTLWIWGHWGPQ